MTDTLGKRCTKEEAKILAEEHWVWVETWLHLMYVDAFVHGYKHGQAAVKASHDKP